ncbi:hypothetical protein [uncultured Methanobrevibacter sp.]|uniref:hypothetical protein n=1 Tax=uncultured Methanobrevibacter sp. TaxID=253161 RepID=UPI0026175EBB|nr:hypothetical protein [uncultured Methanobrevibacter sp.]
MSYTSKIIKVNDKGQLRAGIPSAIIKFLNLTAEDSLTWTPTVKDDKIVIILEKKEE